MNTPHLHLHSIVSKSVTPEGVFYFVKWHEDDPVMKASLKELSPWLDMVEKFEITHVLPKDQPSTDMHNRPYKKLCSSCKFRTTWACPTSISIHKITLCGVCFYEHYSEFKGTAYYCCAQCEDVAYTSLNKYDNPYYIDREVMINIQLSGMKRTAEEIEMEMPHGTSTKLKKLY